MSAIGNAARALLVNLHSVTVLQRAGLIDLRAPVGMLRASRAVRRYGGIAGPVRISARRAPERVALLDELGPLTYRELEERSNALARGLIGLGLGPGDTVAALSRDRRELVDTMLAVAKIGARLVLLNTGFAGPQLADVAAREGVRAVVYDAEFADLLRVLPAEVCRVVAVHEGTAGTPTVEGLIAGNDTAELAPPSRQGGFVLLTGGTTGTPKGVPREVRSPLAAAALLERIPLRRNQTLVLAAPLFHGTALNQFILALSLCSTVVLRRRFDATATLAAVAAQRAQVLVLVPTMLRRILDLGPEALAAHDTSSLRIVFSAGSALPAALGEAATAAFGDVLYNFYGSTEVGVAAIATPRDWRAAPGTVGKPPTACTVRLYDEDGQVITEPGRRGTIYVRSVLSFTGYSGGGTKDSVDGLLSSGDVGHWDAGGRLFIDGRDDDMIVSGGENVFPGEVEELLYAHPAIAEAAIVAVPDDEFGQRLAAFVVRHPGHELDADAVRAHVKANLARFKVPRDVTFVDELPRTNTGKLLRRGLAGH
ncbi:AMP-binding protein [Nocardia brasiliensis]|uniref:AMP-binding protein n=1 Tax=Nocardia brasiliensis TaxID=37326 RepID=A0A6G9Y074_NOCBR|nr:AMP-binding protein [Nocardia brasiliensis]QIS06536.1 AMP-binding protein [Nocardia brasiliensis]